MLGLCALLTSCQSCERLETPAAFRCERDGGATQCLAGWRCGLDGFCFDPQRERVAACQSDLDCAPRYRCGPPLSTAASPEPRCREREIGAAYACGADADCEGGWRCGLAGTCLDTSRESLAPSTPPLALASSKVSSLLDTTALADVAVSDRFEVDATCEVLATTREIVSLISASGELQRLLVPGSIPDGTVVDCDAGRPGAARGLRSPMTLERFSLDAGAVLALAQANATTFVLLEGGKLCRAGADRQVSCEAIGFAARELRTTKDGFVFVFNASVFRMLDKRDGGWSPLLDVEDTNGDAVSLHEVAELRPWRTNTAVLVASTERGFFQIAVDDFGRRLDGGWPLPGDWTPASAGGLECGGPATEVPLGLSYDEVRDQVLVRVRGRASGVEGARVAVWEEGRQVDCAPLGFGTPGQDGGGYAPTVLSHSCADASQRLGSASVGQPELAQLVSAGRAAQTFEARCLGVDGGLEIVQRGAEGTASIGNPAALLAEPFEHPAVMRSRSNLSRSVAVGPSGAVWFELGASRLPLLLDRNPLGLSTLPDGGSPRFVVGTRDVAGTVVPGRALLVGGNFAPVSGLGLAVSGREDLRWEAISGDRPAWSLVSADFQPSVTQQAVFVRGEEEPQPVALTTALDHFSAPFLLAPQGSPDGGTLVLVSAFDALLAADVTRALAAPFDSRRDSLAALPTLTVRAVPLSRSPITSLLALRPQPDPTGRVRLAEGYLVSSGRLFRFEGDNEVVWRTKELEVPFGEPHELLAQQGRARLGYRSGEVFSLPSRVPLAPALPGGEPVLDFLPHCQSLLALTRAGLFRLEVLGTEVQGRWVPVPLPASPGAGASLFSRGREVLLVSAEGTTRTVTGWSCP